MFKMAAASSKVPLVSSVFRSGLFQDKAAIVTGGGTGIGRAIAQELLHLGCKVVIASRNVERLEKAAEEMKLGIPANSPAQLEVLPVNIRKEDQVQSLMSQTLAKFGRIDFLINNGGGQFSSLAKDIRLKGWNAVVETNLTGTFLCCKEAYTQWMEEHGGVIVNIIADMWKGFPTMSHTGAARSAVDNLTKTLSLEWAASGVRVNAVAPGVIYSSTAAANYGDPSFFKLIADRVVTKRLGSPEEGSTIYSSTAAANYGELTIFEHQMPRVPAKRLGTTEEVSAAVCFLLSPAAAFISGETLKVDGAQSLYTTTTPFEIPDHDKIPKYTWEKDIQDQKKKSKL